MVTVHEARRVVAAGARLGEGPLWDPARRLLWFVDILGRRLFAWDGTDLATIDAPDAPGAIALDHAGEVVVALPGRLARVADGTWQNVVVFDPEPEGRCNDGVPDGAGSLLQGTMGWDAEPGVGRLWRLRPDGTGEVLLEDLTIPNGIAVVDDQLWHVDTPTGLLRRYGYHPDEPLGPVLDEVAVDGQPDGLAVDVHGNAWVALWDGGRVVALDRSGVEVARVTLPVSRPTSCAFGPPGSGLLWITSSADGLDEDERRRGAGDLWVADVGVDGAPVPRFHAP